ncbi:hypothetical protein BO70DRAFT_126326 [Aspergillus heteromorphus CBS 117.55]|uniref:Uncharacterized protein n=1 Tax=Aspergillus heteromorphus CBS 117.55 TaxID=1448321 RepID=A0A317VDA1_9EURO|nr:uncharacterized protein BO70DRAFT_126326 [Aspergillus heteromorphus CBS 117.55]PWY70988.1 hypothetical protein BO70DRAFT_126326 [Aspergillus heteromorphus CBS 117.55]
MEKRKIAMARRAGRTSEPRRRRRWWLLVPPVHILFIWGLSFVGQDFLIRCAEILADSNSQANGVDPLIAPILSSLFPGFWFYLSTTRLLFVGDSRCSLSGHQYPSSLCGSASLQRCRPNQSWCLHRGKDLDQDHGSDKRGRYRVDNSIEDCYGSFEPGLGSEACLVVE